MNRREMLKVVVCGALASRVGGPVLDAAEPLARFVVGLGDAAPLVITRGADGRWSAARDGVVWDLADFPQGNWVRIWGANGECKLRICGDHIIDIEWLRFWDGPVVRPAFERE